MTWSRAHAMTTTTNFPRNRHERRRQPSPAVSLAQPDRSTPKGKAKTLFELAEERQTLLAKGTPFAQARTLETRVTSKAGDDDDDDADDADDDEPIGPVGQAVFFSSTLTMLHFTLDVLVQHQYRQEMDWGMIGRRTASTWPMILLLVYLLHPGRTANMLLSQLFFFVAAVASGCYLIYAANDQSYYAVMKRAPPLGTLWVWSVIELRLPYAVLSLLVAVAFLYHGNYSFL